MRRLFWFACIVFIAPPLRAAEPAKVTYADHVLPLLRDKCLGCHNGDKARGGLDASNYVKLMEGGSSGAVVKPGDPDDSRLYTLAAHKAEPKMPPKADPLPAEQINTIKKWIEQGALENSGSKAPLIAKKSEVALVSITRDLPEAWQCQMDHAGRNETSIMFAVAPELVDRSRLPADRSEWPYGVGGEDPGDATAQYGEECIEASLAALGERLDRLVPRGAKTR